MHVLLLLRAFPSGIMCIGTCGRVQGVGYAICVIDVYVGMFYNTVIGIRFFIQRFFLLLVRLYLYSYTINGIILLIYELIREVLQWSWHQSVMCYNGHGASKGNATMVVAPVREVLQWLWHQ